VPLFGDLPPNRLALFVAYARDERIRAGTELQVAGARIDWIRVIVEGQVTCHLEDGNAFQVGPHSVLGVLEFFAGHAPFASRATTDLLALAIPTSAVRDILDAHFDIVVHILRGLGRTLIRSLRDAPTLAGSGVAATLSPHAEHVELGEVERILALRGTRAFRGASVDSLASLARTTQQKTFPRGAVLWTEQDEASWLGVILSGVVECETSLGERRFYFGERCSPARPTPEGLLETTHETSAVGFLDALAGDKRWYGARASSDVVVLTIQRDDLLDTLEDHFEMTLACLSAFSAFSLAIVTRRFDPESGEPLAGAVGEEAKGGPAPQGDR
jgi:CRP-like cAMP-binding protein